MRINHHLHHIAQNHLASTSGDSPSDNILMGIIGAVVTVAGLTLYYIFVKQLTNYQKQIWQIAYCRRTTIPQSLSFVGGTLVAGAVFFLWMGYETVSDITPFGAEDSIQKHTSTIGFALSGLLVGVGAKSIEGGLFEHGYGQMAKANKRSAVGFAVFIIFGIIGGTLAGKEVLPFLSDSSNNLQVKVDHKISSFICLGLGVALLIASFFLDKGDFNNASRVIRKVGSSFVFSFVIAAGLLISGLVRRVTVIFGFCILEKFSPVLLITIAVTAVLMFLFFTLMDKFKDRPFWESIFSELKDDRVNLRIVGGAAAFGLGWGLSGLELATWLLHLPVFTLSIGVFFGGFMIMGMFIWHFVDERLR